MPPRFGARRHERHSPINSGKDMKSNARQACAPSGLAEPVVGATIWAVRTSDSPPSTLMGGPSPCPSKRVPEHLRESNLRSARPAARCWRFMNWVSCRQIRPEPLPLAQAAANAMVRNVSAALRLPFFSGKACLSTDKLTRASGPALVARGGAKRRQRGNLLRRLNRRLGL